MDSELKAGLFSQFDCPPLTYEDMFRDYYMSMQEPLLSKRNSLFTGNQEEVEVFHISESSSVPSSFSNQLPANRFTTNGYHSSDELLE